ncbi:hypothetical protein E6Q11_04190 [Candidatus Dojkabacteria bacterium]|uniref:Peptidase S74 domain-containing protein n=1 Tax=Candidatus Dojkabacteria bacterium TaxID=2099670 RepID=A0A5C7J562_9BACT|nr:MAG: hypothetical protein E6Q11_04190 [Candidatus Dojkabacteria bacterium]
MLVPLLSFISISAAPPASKDDVLRYEVLKGLLVLQQQESASDRPTCLDYSESGQLPLEEELSANEYADANFSPLVSTDSAGYKISQAEFRLPATLHSSSKMSCKEALTYAYGGGKYGGSGESMAVKRQNFIKEYYDTRPGSGPPYKLKANAKTKAYNDIRAYYNELIQGREDSFRWWHDRILSQAFNTCWKWADPANPLTSSTPANQRFNKDNWAEEQGGNKVVGATNEFRVEGAWQDSVVTCEGVRDYIFDTPENRFIMSFGEGALLENLEEATAEAERQQKIDNVTGLFLTSADGLNWCAASVGMLPSGRTANADFLQYIAGWLADGDGTPFVNPFNVDITIKNPTLDDPANPDANPGRTLTPHYSTAMFPDSSQAEITEIFTVFKDCLGTAYPTLEDALAVDFETPSVSRPGTNANGEAAPSCENDSGVLSWITCGVIDLISTTFNWVDTQIQALLGVDREKYTDENMYSVWAAIRNIAFAVLIIMMLVMVIGTAVGTQVFDAYTVKRAMPRMVAAILFISLSWYIVIAMIDLSNIVGNGVLGIMTSPFLDAGQVEAPTFASLFQGGGPGSGGAVGLAANVGGVGAALGITGAMFHIPGAAGIILSWVGTGLLIIGIAFLVLVLRQMMIVALMIFAPIAILSWIFPGNDKLWKFWWSTFSKLLIMFPMIMALIAAGRIFSFSIATTSEGVLSFIIKISAYVIPYLMIPMTFKFAGGFLANIAGMANDRSRGLFDRMKKGRQERMSNIGKQAKAGNLFGRAPADSRLNRWNRRVEGLANIGQAGLDPRRMRTRMRTAMNDSAEAEVEDVLKDDSMTWAGDDAKVHAARYTRHDDIANALAQFDGDRFAGDDNRERREEAVEQILRSQQKFGHEAFQRARIRAQAKTGTGYQDEDGEFNAALMLQDINEAYGNDRNGAGKALAEMRGMLTQSGQIAGQAGYGTWASAMESMHQGGNDATSAVGAAAHRAIMQDTIDSVNPGFAVHGKPSSARALASAHRERIQNLVASMNSGGDLIDTGQRGPNGEVIRRPATMEDVQAATAAAAGILEGLQGASPQNASAFAEELMNADIAGISLNMSNGQQVQPANVRELIDGFENQPMDVATGFHQRKKVFNSQIAAAAAAGGVPQQPNNPAGPAGGAPAGPGMSDFRVKRDVLYLETHSSGIRLYSFRYLWSDTVYVGVIAQELLQTHPEAISKGRDGYYRVDYGKIGLIMTTLDQYQETRDRTEHILVK